MKRSGRTSIADLAQHLGLSISTVSRALNGYTDVNAETRARVVEGARLLDYTPDAVSLKLRQGRTHTVAFVLSPSHQQFVEPFFAPLLTHLDEALRAAGYDLAVSSARPGSDEEAVFRRLVRSRRADAVIFARTRPDDFRIRYLDEQNFGFVSLGMSELPIDFRYVEIDMSIAGRVACERLIGMGHQHIALIHGPLMYMFCRKFRQGYREAMAAGGISIHPDWEIESELNEASGFALAPRLIEQNPRPTAVICNSDSIAFGFMQAAKLLSIEIGSDMSVIGCDDSPIAPLMNPALTTFRSPAQVVGRTLCAMVLDVIAGKTPDPVVFAPQLVPRASDNPPTQRQG
jgi:LacI family transcriptional regulator